MPPKVAPPVVGPAGSSAATASGTSITVKVRVFKPMDHEGGVEQPATKGIRLRAFTTWPRSHSAVTTPIFGELNGSMAWTPATVVDNNEVDSSGATRIANHTDKLVSTVEYSFRKEINGQEELRDFHQNSGIYFVFSRLDGSRVELVNAFHVDCGVFLVDSAQSLTLCRHVHGRYDTEITVSIEHPLMGWKDLLALQPVLLRLKR
jgi:hypothetical protein